jgi:hypothetical protein
VQFRDGPTAVTGDENCINVTATSNRNETRSGWCWEGAVSRVIRKSEDLPENRRDIPLDKDALERYEINGHPGSLFMVWDFFFRPTVT